MEIVKVIRSGKATIVFWDDGTKTIVKLSGEDFDNFEAAISAAVLKKALGSRTKVKAFLEEVRAVTVCIGGVMMPDPPEPEPESEPMGVKEKSAEALRLYESGKSYEEIGKTLNLTKETARYYANRERARLRSESEGAANSKVDAGKMMALLEAGWQTKDVAVEFGVSEQTIANQVYKHTGMKLGEWRKNYFSKA